MERTGENFYQSAWLPRRSHQFHDTAHSGWEGTRILEPKRLHLFWNTRPTKVFGTTDGRERMASPNAVVQLDCYSKNIQSRRVTPENAIEANTIPIQRNVLKRHPNLDTKWHVQSGSFRAAKRPNVAASPHRVKQNRVVASPLCTASETHLLAVSKAQTPLNTVKQTRNIVNERTRPNPTLLKYTFSELSEF